MYLTDQDARPASASSSVAHLWDNGANVVDGLANVMAVRAAALRRFGENNIREGAPMATLEDVLVPLYMYHRYQVEAAAKLVGGEDYTFSLRGKGDRNPQIISPDEQKRALYAVLGTLKPENLALPRNSVSLLPLIGKLLARGHRLAQSALKYQELTCLHLCSVLGNAL